MLANLRLRYLVFALPKLHRKKKPGEKNLERLKPIVCESLANMDGTVSFRVISRKEILRHLL
jgi:hypothetical protein